MRIIKSIKAMTGFSLDAKRAKRTIGFVPTMGYLHAGHLSLVKAAGKSCDFVVVSIFVNPIQFGPKEDLKKYPRDLKRDFKLLSRLKVDVVFVPTEKDIFPKDFSTFVEVPSLSKILCGKTRPIHFRGVATIVAKLFNIIKPDLGFLGRKDYQQVAVIKRMAQDLNMDVKVVDLPTVRERDGLAMSSRNVYLSKNQRSAALSLYKSLQLAGSMIKEGETGSRRIMRAMVRLISSAKPKIRIEYVEMCDPLTLERKKKVKGPALIAVAAFVGKTRLIDNIEVRG
jgi:pantoate--beta-alanine ligase